MPHSKSKDKETGGAKIFDMALHFTNSYLEDSLALFRYYKHLADRAMAQVTDQQLVAVFDGCKQARPATVSSPKGRVA